MPEQTHRKATNELSISKAAGWFGFLKINYLKKQTYMLLQEMKAPFYPREEHTTFSCMFMGQDFR